MLFVKMLVVAALVIMTGCEATPVSPTSPSATPVTPPSVATFPVPLPGTTETASIRVISFDPATRVLTWTVVVPNGYEIWVSTILIGPEPSTSAIGGGSSERGGDPSIASMVVPNEYRGIKVTKVRFQVWVAPKGERIGFPDRVADIIRDFVIP